MKNSKRTIFGRFGSVVVAFILLSTALAMARSKPVPVDSPTPVAVVNASFEDPATLSENTYTVGNVPGWQLLPGAWNLGVWRPSAAYFAADAQFDGANILYLNGEGVSQTLPITLEASTDYTISVLWGHRVDTGLTAPVLQFVANGQILASCQPEFGPAAGKVAMVTLVYHSGHDNYDQAIGKPLSIQLSKGKDLGVNPLVWSQVDLDDVQVTYQGFVGLSSRNTIKQECSVTLFQ